MAADDGVRRPGRVRGPVSVRARTTLAASAVVGLALVIGAVAFAAQLRSTLTGEVRAAAQARADQVAAAFEAGEARIGRLGDEEDELVQVLDAACDVVASSPNVAGRPAVAQPDPGGSAVVTTPVDDGSFLAVSASADTADGPVSVVVARSLDDVRESVRAVTGLLAVGVPVLLLVVVVTTWKVVGRALAPVDAITTEVARISGSDLHRRVPSAGDDEIGRLATTMNGMLDRLEAAQRRQHRFVSDASHELRSPMASIRQHAEVALSHPGRTTTPELAGTVLAESLRVQRLVDALLLLARSDEDALVLEDRAVDLDDLVLDEARHLRGTTALRIDSAAVSAGQVRGDPAALTQVVRNLADNAARHADRTIRLSLAESDGWVTLGVEDDGRGIPEAERARVLERFVRLDEARARDDGGAGLGLSIVAELVRAHRGRVTIERGELGGARVVVRLPGLDAEHPSR